MRNSRFVYFLMLLPLVMIGCRGGTPQHLIEEADHAGLVSYYTQEAQTLRQKAQEWEFMAEFYEQHPASYAKANPAQHAAHCRAITESYRKAAGEAEALAREHRERLPEPKRD